MQEPPLIPPGLSHCPGQPPVAPNGTDGGGKSGDPSANRRENRSKTTYAALKPDASPSLPVLPLCPAPPPRTADSFEAVLPQPDAQGIPVQGMRWWWFRHRGESGFLVSFLAHATLLVALALIVEVRPVGSPGGSLTVFMEGPAPLDTLLEEGEWDAVEVTPEPTFGNLSADPAQAQAAEVSIPEEAAGEPSESPPETIGLQPARATDWLLARDSLVGGGLEGRNPEPRAALLATRGGTPQSEAAVERGLRWLAAHQAKDGSWHFNLQYCNCNGYCRNPGTVATTTGATALSLLAFLGANHTHLEGEHREVVRKGLYYLGNKAKITSDGADLQDGTMYAQGLAAIALCEAYAISDDPGLKDLAQQAIHFIVFAQDKKGGGWRYTPGEPGDTTVTGWQMMALKSGLMARLQVPSPTIFLAERFLDSVQSDQGALYGYMNLQPRNSTTAIGLLCRMYTGWTHSRPALARGIAHLSRWGPSEDDLYYDYYATQVMFHWGGSDWERWNRTMRDHLVSTQGTQGHESGSWHFSGRRADSAGRLYSTALAVMILEVYYRYLPLYGKESFEK